MILGVCVYVCVCVCVFVCVSLYLSVCVVSASVPLKKKVIL